MSGQVSRVRLVPATGTARSDGLVGWVSFATPDGLLEIDYIIDQKNKDSWNALLGFNWDINKRLSWSLEYDGFIGSRDAFITSFSWKY